LTTEEIRRLRGERLGEAELRRAKDHLKGGLVLSLESTAARMSQLAREEIYFGRAIALDEVLAALEAVTAEDVQRIANDIFRRPLAASVVGDLKGWRPREKDLAI
jgi:predicted Zn-dependent peptidase